MKHSLRLAGIAVVALVVGLLTTTGTAHAATRHTIRMHDVAGSSLVGTWTIVASDNEQGQLVIGGVDAQGNLTNSTAFGDTIVGTWDSSAGTIYFIRQLNGSTTGTGNGNGGNGNGTGSGNGNGTGAGTGTGTSANMANYKMYAGYLVMSQTSGSQQSNNGTMMLVGSFESFGTSAGTGTGMGTGTGSGTGTTQVNVGGWYASQVQGMTQGG